MADLSLPGVTNPRSINEYMLEELPQDYVTEMVREFEVDILCFGQSPEGVQVEFIKVKYDVEKAARAVELSLLPDDYKNRRTSWFVISQIRMMILTYGTNKLCQEIYGNLIFITSLKILGRRISKPYIRAVIIKK